MTDQWQRSAQGGAALDKAAAIHGRTGGDDVNVVLVLT